MIALDYISIYRLYSEKTMVIIECLESALNNYPHSSQKKVVEKQIFIQRKSWISYKLGKRENFCQQNK